MVALNLNLCSVIRDVDKGGTRGAVPLGEFFPTKYIRNEAEMGQNVKSLTSPWGRKSPSDPPSPPLEEAVSTCLRTHQKGDDRQTWTTLIFIRSQDLSRMLKQLLFWPPSSSGLPKYQLACIYPLCFFPE